MNQILTDYNQERLLQVEKLVSDLIRFTAQAHVKVCSYEEQIKLLTQRIVTLEEYVAVLVDYTTNLHSYTPSQTIPIKLTIKE